MSEDYQVKVKICGITGVDMALAAVEAGADALGFVFAPSRRRVQPETARAIIAQLPPFVARVGVFVNSPPGEIEQIARHCGLTAVQLSGDEPPGYALDLALPIIRSLRVGNGKPVPDLNGFKDDAFLFDTYCDKSYGGTGKTFDWSLLENIACPKPVILAGGLNPFNVREAVRTVRPYAVDVSGGVETNGQKDAQKIKEFITLAKGV
ncbi:phosphoribosylanthranilate isomerase [Desulfotomaculum arcticum]|uniref:N-(5'-phosphoribosyl)anthranilate isomerase n=1 Tax=Desulfotruncus arcticus DSM 17038 TaxID=1121424 RepID=A0A1I2Q8G6_9FIRM|nr:phosphoribosylanthranilate isomerase [Desulfotruncus arcticus]SFG24785.1 phosphoribosylanthranilate isomerase [Desulfotomaculum arcticum] [Desulfotruncus arcticus DSM 17038]